MAIPRWVWNRYWYHLLGRKITLITRPRRFGKTLNMDTLNCFFLTGMRADVFRITRVSKESIFSDLNNLEVVTTTETKYATSFGFTEEEVFAALEDFEVTYYLKLTNFEVKRMFQKMFSGWFRKQDVPYGDFIHAMQTGNRKEVRIGTDGTMVNLERRSHERI